ncbi:glycosyltransferase family 2 protein [Lacticaseibacillus porcinae]|uniref:glycosyltransferase family 2 protein n=1 Tax=Lacticaseibacillus porcinae TaxID=1123687 RepID=UPI0013DD87C1|nr:glycosyltransferase [Lacticaseibacillus porcinae]
MVQVSIITPVYNVEEYLPKCIESILAQTFRDFELIIVDDGSPDKSGSIADGYAKTDSRIRVIHKQNGGAPSARNTGIDVARGKYLYFPDSDDWIDSNYIQTMYDYSELTQAELVMSGFTMKYVEAGTAFSYHVSEPAADFENNDAVKLHMHTYFDNTMLAVPWNKFYLNSYIQDNHLRFPDVKWDDLHFNVEVLMNIKHVAVCNTFGYHFFRSRPGSETTTVFDGQLFKKRKEQFTHILRLYEHWNITDSNILSNIYGYYAGRLIECVQNVSTSNAPDKINLVREILNDPLTIQAMHDGQLKSSVLSILSIPIKQRWVGCSIMMGKTIGFVKTHMSRTFYQMKSTIVNRAIKEN